MSTVTIGKAYFDALLRRAQFHTSGHEFKLAPDLLSHVTVSKAEYDHLQQCSLHFALLKSALFRGGLTMDTLNTLLTSENEATMDDSLQHKQNSEKIKTEPEAIPMQGPWSDDNTPSSDDKETVSDHLVQPRPRSLHRACTNDPTQSCVDEFSEEEQNYRPERGRRGRIPTHDRRTILVSNLAERTTHKDLAGIIRGGRLLDIFFRSDRSATVSFIEGAADFLAYVKRNDIYLHAKRLEFRWADRQFTVTPHLANKIAGGASRNFIVHGVYSRVTQEQIRDHLDHIHNLVVIDVHFRNGDAHISTNSIHNALSARTCMLSRTIYKGTRIDWAPDECAAPLPQPDLRTRPPAVRNPTMPVPITNTYALLDTGSEIDSDTQVDSYMPNGFRLEQNHWTNTVAT